MAIRKLFAWGHATVAWKLDSTSLLHNEQMSLGSNFLINFARRVGRMSLASFQINTLTLGGTRPLQTRAHSFLSPPGAELVA